MAYNPASTDLSAGSSHPGSDLRPLPSPPTPVSDLSQTRSASDQGTDLLHRVVQGAHDTVDRMASTAEPHVQRLGDGVEAGSDRLHAGADQVRAVGDEWIERVRSTVREHPIACIAGALAAGMFLARAKS